MPRVVVAPLQSATQLRRGLSPGRAAEYGTVDGDELVVDDADTAAQLVEQYPNVDWATEESAPDVDSGTPRMVADNDGVEYRCGVNGCSRTVDSPDAVCWQHEDAVDDDNGGE